MDLYKCTTTTKAVQHSSAVPSLNDKQPEVIASPQRVSVPCHQSVQTEARPPRVLRSVAVQTTTPTDNVTVDATTQTSLPDVTVDKDVLENDDELLSSKISLSESEVRLEEEKEQIMVSPIEDSETSIDTKQTSTSDSVLTLTDAGATDVNVNADRKETDVSKCQNIAAVLDDQIAKEADVTNVTIETSPLTDRKTSSLSTPSVDDADTQLKVDCDVDVPEVCTATVDEATGTTCIPEEEITSQITFCDLKTLEAQVPLQEAENVELQERSSSPPLENVLIRTQDLREEKVEADKSGECHETGKELLCVSDQEDVSAQEQCSKDQNENVPTGNGTDENEAFEDEHEPITPLDKECDESKSDVGTASREFENGTLGGSDVVGTSRGSDVGGDDPALAAKEFALLSQDVVLEVDERCTHLDAAAREIVLEVINKVLRSKNSIEGGCDITRCSSPDESAVKVDLPHPSSPAQASQTAPECIETESEYSTAHEETLSLVEFSLHNPDHDDPM